MVASAHSPSSSPPHLPTGRGRRCACRVRRVYTRAPVRARMQPTPPQQPQQHRQGCLWHRASGPAWPSAATPRLSKIAMGASPTLGVKFRQTRICAEGGEVGSDEQRPSARAGRQVSAERLKRLSRACAGRQVPVAAQRRVAAHAERRVRRARPRGTARRAAARAARLRQDRPRARRRDVCGRKPRAAPCEPALLHVRVVACSFAHMHDAGCVIVHFSGCVCGDQHRGCLVHRRPCTIELRAGQTMVAKAHWRAFACPSA